MRNKSKLSEAESGNQVCPSYPFDAYGGAPMQPTQSIQPKISVLIPCFNAERWIGQAIESALQQTYAAVEVIVVDDGSTDGSLGIIRGFGDRIRWHTQPNNGGNATRNRLLYLSTGEWLQYLDADDHLLPTKIAAQVGYLAQHPTADVIYSPSLFEHHPPPHAGDTQPVWQILPIPEPHDPWILLARWYLPQTGSPLWRKQAIQSVGGWAIDHPCCQEHELYLRLLMAGKQFEYFSGVGSVYRQWSESTVCKQNRPETYRRRLAILDRAEAHLHLSHALTPARQNALNQSRFECARLIWLVDPEWAIAIIQQIQTTSRFIPSGLAAPKSYQWMYHWLGFSRAEAIAAQKRRFFKQISNYPRQ